MRSTIIVQRALEILQLSIFPPNSDWSEVADRVLSATNSVVYYSTTFLGTPIYSEDRRKTNQAQYVHIRIARENILRYLGNLDPLPPEASDLMHLLTSTEEDDQLTHQYLEEEVPL